MEVMVLAAGIGSRLGELTRTTPKCLIEVAGRPILEWNLLKLKNTGATRIVINIYHLAESVRSFLESNNNFGLDIKLSREPELLNTGGGLKFAEHLFSGYSPILALNADILCSVNLRALYENFASKTGAALVTRAPEEPRVLLFQRQNHQLAGWRNTLTGEEQLITPTEENRERGFCGIQVISPVIFDYFGRPEEKQSSIGAYISASKAGISILEYPADEEYWFDIGTPEQLENCRHYFEEHGMKPV